MVPSILLIDTHIILRERSIAAFIKATTDIKIIGEATSIENALCLLEHLDPDVVVMDLDFMYAGELEMIRQIKQHIPDKKIVILSSHHEKIYVQKAVEVGACSYVFMD